MNVLRISTLIGLGLLAGFACAQPPEGRGSGRGGFRGPNLTFGLLDTDGDGTLSLAEIDAAPAVLAKLDKNSDGQITAEEVHQDFEEIRPRGGPGRPEGDAGGNVVDETVKRLMAYDANGDGKLTKAELPERMQGIFDRADENHDGVLTGAEIRKYAAAQAPPPQSERREGREGRGGQMNFIRMDPVLAAIDANGDGVISAEELRNAPKAIRKLDTDGDGKVTREEAMASMRQRGFEPR